MTLRQPGAVLALNRLQLRPHLLRRQLARSLGRGAWPIATSASTALRTRTSEALRLAECVSELGRSALELFGELLLRTQGSGVVS